jgi:hypothetical protein
MRSTGRVKRRFLAITAGALSCCWILSGCGEQAPTHDVGMPTPEWSSKFETEHPELFKKKQGKRYSEVSIRERRNILSAEWAKAQGQGQ